MARKKKPAFHYNEVDINGYTYLKTYFQDIDGKQIILYGRTIDELIEKVDAAKHQSENDEFIRRSPTVKEYCEKWLLMQSANVRATTMIDDTSKVNRHIIKPLGHLRMAEVTADDIKLAMVPVSKKSMDLYNKVNMLFKCIFYSAEYSNLIDYNPSKKINAKGGVPRKEKEPLTDKQVEILLDTVKGLPPYLFVMLGLYSGLRREEILALKWDCVFLDDAVPYISVRRAWRSVHNRPVISEELKTKAAFRDVPAACKE